MGWLSQIRVMAGKALLSSRYEKWTKEQAFSSLTITLLRETIALCWVRVN